MTLGPRVSSRRSGAGRGPRALLVALALLLGLSQPLRAAELVFRLETGEVLASQEADRLWHPASLTKLMTAYVVFQELATGRLSLDSEIVASEAAARQPPTSLGLAEGRSLTLEEALLGMLMRSGNDAAVALAETVSGSEAAFATLMNETAARLGMTASHFANASGLPDDSQVTTARDLALLTRRLLLDFPQYYGYFGLSGFSFAGSWQGNINGILNSLPGADGLKTGFTCKSGYNLVVSALRDGKRIVAVVLGERSPAQRRQVAQSLVEAAFARLAAREAPVDGEAAAADPAAEGGSGEAAGDEEAGDEGAGDGAVPAGPGPILAAALPAAVAAAGGPPTVLDENECGYGVAASRLPGHGVVLGAFSGRGKALSVAEDYKARYGAFAGAGTAAVPSKIGKGRFNAVLVGLSQREAQDGCRAIRKAGSYCLVLSNQVLNNPAAVWR